MSPRQWLPHVDESCVTRQLHDTKAKGGRPKKGKHLGRPPQTGPNPEPLGTSALVHEVRIIMHQVSSFHGTSKSLSLANFTPLPPPLRLEHFTCNICGNLLDQPVELSCSHTFCGNCLAQQLPGAASAFWELPLSHYELQKQHHRRRHEKKHQSYSWFP